jgi:hypothetical protein
MAQLYSGYDCEQVTIIASRIPDTIVAFGQTRHNIFSWYHNLLFFPPLSLFIKNSNLVYTNKPFVSNLICYCEFTKYLFYNNFLVSESGCHSLQAYQKVLIHYYSQRVRRECCQCSEEWCRTLEFHLKHNYAYLFYPRDCYIENYHRIRTECLVKALQGNLIIQNVNTICPALQQLARCTYKSKVCFHFQGGSICANLFCHLFLPSQMFLMYNHMTDSRTVIYVYFQSNVIPIFVLIPI